MTDSSWFSLRRFTVALGTVALGTAGGVALIAIPFLGAIGPYIGILMGGFAAGLAFDDRPLLESGAAGLVSGIGYMLVSRIVDGGLLDGLIGLITLGPQILLLTAVLSFGLGALGAHFGNDFRDGLTRPVEEPRDGPAR